MHIIHYKHSQYGLQATHLPHIYNSGHLSFVLCIKLQYFTVMAQVPTFCVYLTVL